MRGSLPARRGACLPDCEPVARLPDLVCDNDPPKAGAATYRFIPKNRQQCYITQVQGKKQAFFHSKLTLFCKAEKISPGKGMFRLSFAR